MTEDNIKKTLSHFQKKSVFCQILWKKICILPNSKGKKSVYTDKISMSGRSAVTLYWNKHNQYGDGAQGPDQTHGLLTRSPELYLMSYREMAKKWRGKCREI